MCVLVQVEEDAGVPDAGEDGGEDAGIDFDAGTDAGADLDAGEEDAGVEDDAGVDAGPMDAGCPAVVGGNRIVNAGFECGSPPDGWVTLNGSLTTETADPYSGMQAARVQTSNTVAAMSLFPAAPPIEASGAARYCAGAYVRGTSGQTVRMAIRVSAVGGGIQDSNFSQPLTNTWEPISVAANTTANDDDVTVRVFVPNAPAGTSLVVDDVVLYRSLDGGCSAP